jgi:hypothetical protein
MKMNKFMKNSSLLILISIILLLVVFVEMHVAAKEISLRKAIVWGIEHNLSLREIKDNVETLERKLGIIEAGKSWKVDIISENQRTVQEDDSSVDGGKISLEVTKSFSGGLIIGSELYLEEQDWSTFGDIEDELNFTFTAIQNIYPHTVIEIEQEACLVSYDLLKAKENLTWQQNIKEIDFLESYLNILSLKEKLSLVETNYQCVRSDLDRVLKQIEIGEADLQQELEARIALEKAEISFQQAKNNFQQQKQSWYLDLNLPKEVEISLKEEQDFFKEIEKWVTSLKLEIDLNNKDKLMDLVISSHFQIKTNLLDQDSACKEVEWNLAEDKPQINLSGGYDYQSSVWYAGIELTYNLFDGGEQKLENQEYEAKLNTLEDNHLYLINELEFQLDNLIDQLELSNMNLKEKTFSYQKAKLEEKLWQEQLEQGLVSKRSFQEKLISWGETEIELKSAEDAILINKLRIAHFLGFER